MNVKVVIPTSVTPMHCAPMSKAFTYVAVWEVTKEMVNFA